MPECPEHQLILMLVPPTLLKSSTGLLTLESQAAPSRARQSAGSQCARAGKGALLPPAQELPLA